MLVAITAAVGIALQRTFHGAAAEFNWYGLRALWFDLPVFLFVGWLAARFAPRPLALLAATLVFSVALTGLLHLVLQGLRRTGQIAWIAVYYGWYVWFLLMAIVLLRRTARLAYRHLPLAIIPLVALSAYEILFPSGSIWYDPPAEQRAAQVERDTPVREELLYLQPRLAAQTMNAIARERPGVTDLYFVGFAPYARQDVFRKEAETIRALMDERFDTRDRSVLLVNNDRTLRKYPLATVTNLRAALKRIGQRINPREDVVMVYLTSHGDKDHRLSADYWPLELQEVDPALLKELLDEAGIRWRVIVVSACYAGGFIEPLRGPTTLIMTAADATHTSFGCSSTSDFTYFAKALFDEQLRETHSFEQAFERAVPIIRTREREQQEAFSNPQIAMGDAIRAKLADLERRLDRVRRADRR